VARIPIFKKMGLGSLEYHMLTKVERGTWPPRSQSSQQNSWGNNLMLIATTKGGFVEYPSKIEIQRKT